MGTLLLLRVNIQFPICATEGIKQVTNKEFLQVTQKSKRLQQKKKVTTK